MDPYFNVAVAISLVILTVTIVFLVGAILPLLGQASRTLVAYEKLADTVETELKPTLLEFREAVDGFNQIRNVTQQIGHVGTRVEEAADSLTHVADKAQRHGTVWGTGLFAGVRAYLNADESGITHTKQIVQNKGEGNG